LDKSKIAKLETEFGVFNIQIYISDDGKQHAVLWIGDIYSEESLLVRPQSSCITGTSFSSIRCDCNEQKNIALREISETQRGLFIYIDEEGRDHGLLEKINALNYMNNGYSTITSLTTQGKEVDLRKHTNAVELTKAMTTTKNLTLLTNNPDKIKAFERAGFYVKRKPIEASVTKYTEQYLRIKKTQLNHLLSNV
jgi:3,4-dihydroxy 2-butanone 4-phosphate synthase/GTP cyclohydrolase II